MTLTALLNLPVTITQRTASASIDEFGNEIPAEATVDTVCELQQRQSTEPGADGETSIADFLLILPASTDITTGDKATIAGVNYEVIGDPWQARNPRTQLESHVEATVRRTAGSEDAS